MPISGGQTDSIQVQVSSNGGASYSTLASFTSGSNHGSGTKSFDISGFIVPVTEPIEASGDHGLGRGIGKFVAGELFLDESRVRLV